MKTEQDWVKEWREDSSLNRWRYDELELEKRIKQIQLDAQKHGEQIGWYRGMKEASKIAEKWAYTESCDAANEIISARNNLKTNL